MVELLNRLFSLFELGDLLVEFHDGAFRLIVQDVEVGNIETLNRECLLLKIIKDGFLELVPLLSILGDNIVQPLQVLFLKLL